MPSRSRSPLLAAILSGLVSNAALARVATDAATQTAPDVSPQAAPGTAAKATPQTGLRTGSETGSPSASRTGPAPARPAHRRHHRVSRAAAAAASPVLLTQQPGTALDAAARRLDAEDLSDAARRRETPIVLIGSAPLSAARTDPALFVQVQSASLCGSAGCSTSVYLKRGGAWTKVLDSVSGPIKVLPETHGGMHDLMVGDRDRWVWSGSTYHDTLPAAPIGNLRSSVERHQALTGQKGG